MRDIDNFPYSSVAELRREVERILDAQPVELSYDLDRVVEAVGTYDGEGAFGMLPNDLFWMRVWPLVEVVD